MAKRETTIQKSTQTEQPKPVSKNPLVFISHDTRDAELAEALSQLLSNSSMGILESFRSSDKKGAQGIEYGTLWYEEIFKKLNEASDVVCLLTHHSVDRPWILYEAGIAIGKSGTPLIGIALGLPLNKANNGPFAQFQNCADDIDSLTKLVSGLVRKIPNARPIDEVIKGQVVQFLEKVKPILEKHNQKVSETDTNTLVEDTAVAKLFEEIKIMFQDLPSRIDRNLLDNGSKQFRKLHPMMVEELMHMTKDQNIVFLMALSMFRNDAPWIYDLGTETLRKIRESKSMKEKEIAVMDFERVLEISIHNPYFEENTMRNIDSYRILREVALILKRALHRMIKNNDKE
ncbi:toll/interleukin-1 receptor domain-containing protein [Runella zeae]|uniref:toll/interleukin-1 receptor domain-containing protein n=1 Tax=Runella zeae TaxID=94255 RepID=UPI00235337E2|nr:toll/interleukin-1 receptor domain-containing protein [Runella zeae]